MQKRDRIQCLTLARLNHKLLCPYTAVKALSSLYPMSATTSLLPYIPLTDSKIRKTFKKINFSSWQFSGGLGLIFPLGSSFFFFFFLGGGGLDLTLGQIHYY